MNALSSNDILIGGGHLYVTTWNPATGIPSTSFDTDANLLGHIKEGATLTYTPSFYEATDDLQEVSKTIKTSEELVFKSGLITWNLERLPFFVTGGKYTAAVTTQGSEAPEQFEFGGGSSIATKFLFHFVHEDGVHELYFVGSNQAGFELGFKKDAETSLNAEFKAVPMDDEDHKGRLAIYINNTPAN